MQDEKHETGEQETGGQETGEAPCQPHGPNGGLPPGALLLQEKWVLMIVHSLMGGSISFNALMRRGASTRRP